MISTRTHGVIDYVSGALLIVAPYIFGFATGGIEQWLPQVLGAMIIVMSLLTDYELSIAKVTPSRFTLASTSPEASCLRSLHGCSGSPT